MIHLRADTNDASLVVQDVEEYESLRIISGDVVLDLGGHIGLFALQMYKRGASRVISVEPEADNCKYHRLNTADFHQHVLLQAAVVGNSDLTRNLYLNPRKNKAWHTLQPLPGRDSLSVPALNFQCLLALARPSVLKVDIEDTEYELQWLLPDCVRSLAVEFHSLPNEKHSYILAKLHASGFNLTYKGNQDRTYILHILERQ